MRDKSLNVPATLDIAPRKVIKHKSHLQSSVFCVNEIKITHSTGNDFLYGQSRCIVIWSTNTNVMKDKNLNVSAILDIAPRKVTKHKSHLQSSVVCLNQIKMTHSTGNDIFYGQFRLILIWSRNKNVMKDKSLNVPATLDIAPRKVTKHKSHLQSSIFCLNQIKITHSTGNDCLCGQSRWISIWSTNKNVMKDKSLNVPATLDIGPRKVTKHKSHLQSSVFSLNQIKITHSTKNDFLYGQSRWILILSRNKNVMKDKSLNVPATLDIAPRKIRKHKSHLQLSVFCLNQIKMRDSTGNDFFYGQFRWILIWSTNKNVMKDKSLNVPATLDMAPRKITKHKSHLQWSVFCLNEIKITYSTGNDFFYGQSRWIVIWSTNKNVMKDKSLNVSSTLDMAPRKITKHKSHLQSSVFCLNQIKITYSTGNDFFYGQSRWIVIWSTNKNVMKDKSLNGAATVDIAPRKVTKHKSHLQSSIFCLIQIKITHSTGNDFLCGQSRWISIWSTNKNVMKDKSLNIPATLDISRRKITKHKSHLQSSVFCLNQIKMTDSTGNDFFYGQFRWILIWSTNKNVMKDKSLNVPATLDMAPRKITKHKSHLQWSVFCLNEIKITYSTGNDFFYGQSRWIVIWSTNKNVMKDKSLNVSATLDMAPRKITKHKSHLQSSVFCLNQIKITYSTGNDFFYGQSRWIVIWSTNKNVMKDKSLNGAATVDIAPRKVTKHKSHLQSSIFCLIQIKITHSTGNDFLCGQSRWISIWSTNKNVMKDKSLNIPATLDISPRKITKHKSHLQSSVFCLNQIKMTDSTGNDFFYGQFRWILIWSTNKNVMKDKSLNVPATLDMAPRKITKHKSHLQWSVFCLNQIKMTHSTGNDFFYGQSRWILIWSTNKNVMKDKSLNVPATLDIARYAPSWKIRKHKSTGGGGGGGQTIIFLTAMLIREQISTFRKRRMTQNSNPKTEQCNVCQSLNKYEKLLWFYVFQYCVFFIQRIEVCDATIGRWFLIWGRNKNVI